MAWELEFKPDFPATARRFEAWLEGEIADRPPVSLSVAPSRPYRGPAPRHTHARERWLDVEYVVDRAVAEMARTDYPSDRFPSYWGNVGPEVTGALFGCPLEFTETTSWSVPVVQEPGDWERVMAQGPDFSNPYWRAMENMTEYALAQSRGRFLVGLTDLHGNYDILASLRDPQALCLDLMDCPDLVREAGRRAAAAFRDAFLRQHRRIAAVQPGSTSWGGFYYEGPSYVPSCDFWCVLSAEMARDFVAPDIRREMEVLDRSLFHLDGPQALQHLDLLLEWPDLDAVQWVYGAGNGPAAKWIPVYRRILAAGKSVEVIAADAADALAVLDALGPRGVWLAVGSVFKGVDEAQALLKEVERRSVRGR